MKKSLLAAVLVSTLASGQERALNIIPSPQHLAVKPDVFRITSQVRIVLGERATGDDEFAAEQVNSHLAQMGVDPLRIVREEQARKLTANYIYIGSPRTPFAREWLKGAKLQMTPAMKDEGYILHAGGDRVVLLAESPRGRFYGVMTLLQLITRQGRTLRVPGVEIRDWPLQKIRGITDDLSRGQVSTMDNFKKIIRFLGRHKLNVYSPYIEDIFVFKRHPAIGKGRGELTAEEMKELDAYARRYHVEVIPIFETLGHWENILVLPEYARYAEFPGAHTVNISDEAVYALLNEMIGELAAAFSSPYFNIAADESWDVGLGANKARVAASDLATVHAEHYKRVFEILKKYRKKPMMYGDIILNHPEILEKIPKEVTIVDWHYDARDLYESPTLFSAAGFPYVVSPAVWNFTGPFPNYINTFVNIQNINRDGYRNGSLGILTSNWNDYGGEALRELNYYGYAWTAECAWSPLGADLSTFNTKFFSSFFGNDAAGRLGHTIYAILSQPLNQMNWHELWQHPFLPLRQPSPPWLWRVQSIAGTMPLVHSLLDELEKVATDNRSHLPYLRFVTRLNEWFGKKIAASEAIKRMVSGTLTGAERGSAQASARELMRTVVADLKKLREEFRTLWLATNRPANLQWLMLRYDRQALYWAESEEEMAATGTISDPVIESRWIYHPAANPRQRDTTQVQRASFRKTFTIDEAPTSAKLQLIGDTHAKVWVNGTNVGEVFARRSLSLMVEHHRVKVWEVGALLRPGTNVIAVEAANYDQNGSAGVNVFLELQTGERLFRVLTDESWKVTDRPDNGWTSFRYDDRQWIAAAVKPYVSPVVRPNFATGRPSWIER